MQLWRDFLPPHDNLEFAHTNKKVGENHPHENLKSQNKKNRVARAPTLKGQGTTLFFIYM